MKAYLVRPLSLLGACCTLAAPLVARGQATNCDPTGSVSGVVGRAQFSMTRAINAVQGTGNPLNDLKDVVRLLADDKTDNVVARDWLLGEAYVLLLSQPGIAPVSPRSVL